MKKGKIFSFGVYRLTLKRLLLPFTVFTVLLGIALFFLLLLTQISTQRYAFSSLEELIEQLSRYLGMLVSGTVLFPILLAYVVAFNKQEVLLWQQVMHLKA